MENSNMKNVPSKKDLKRLDRMFKRSQHLLIVVHTNPDPDAIASASALKYLVEKRYSLETSIAYSGNIGRAENRAMIKELNIQMKQIAKINWVKYDRIALVDTQPGSGNNALPDDVKCHLVLDHHPARKMRKTEMSFIQPELGVLSSMLIEWLRVLEIEISSDLATALVYAINSESQNLNREVNKRDMDAYLHVYVRSNLKKLGRIMTPRLPRQYFISVAKTLQKAVTYKNLVTAHLGDVKSVEIVSEMADFLVRQERISWSLCTGRIKNRLIISLRSTNSKAEAGLFVQKLVKNSKNVGGHGMSAGGFIDINGLTQNDLEILENKMSKAFAELHNSTNPEWKSLINV
jgi:nanoRNase/pAp phosphatase (c-di-AMP/oligoRNAs hydrolase)